MSKPSRAGFLPLALVGAACFLSFFWQLGRYGLFDLDEGLYVEAAREMNLSGDFIIPRVNGLEFFEKPPLVYWLSALSQRVLGRNEFAARLPAAAASTLLAIIILLVGNRFFGPRAGLFAGLMYPLSPLVFGAGRQLTMDAVLSLFTAGAIFAYFRGYMASGKGGGGWFYLFWACCGFGTLAKGAPGLLIPLATVAVFLIIAEGAAPGIRRLFTSTRMLFGIGLFLLIVLPWHAAAWQASGKAFVDEYIIRQHLNRFRGGDTAHRAPFWFYVPSFLILFFPWSFFTLPALLERTAPREGKNRNPAELARLLCKVWFALVFIMFSVSGSKLVSYILPLFAPAALLASDWGTRASAQKDRQSTFQWALGLAALLSGLLFVVALLHEHIIAQVESFTRRPVPMDQVTPDMITFATVLLGASAAATMAAWIMAVMKRGGSIWVLAGGMAAFIGVAVQMGLPAVDTAYLAPLREAATFAGRRASETEKLVFLTTGRRPSALFYLPDRLLPHAAERAGPVLELIQRRDNRDPLPPPPYFVVTRDADPAPTARTGQILFQRGGWRVIHKSP